MIAADTEKLEFPRILLVDSCSNTLTFVADALAGCAVDSCPSLDEASTQLSSRRYDLILTELSLPNTDLSSLLYWIKAQADHHCRPVVVLSRSGDIANKVVSFEVGAQDFMTKPIHPLEFRARVMSRLSYRRQEPKRDTGKIEYGPIHLTPSRLHCAVQTDGRAETIKLTPIEFRLLHFLLKQANQVVSRHQIMEEVWGHDIHIHMRSVDKHVHTIKTKLLKSGVRVESVHGIGYRICLIPGSKAKKMV